MTINKDKLLIPGLIGLGLILVLLATIWSVNTFSFKIASFNPEKIFKESEVGKDLEKDLSRKFEEAKARRELVKTDAEKQQIAMEFDAYKNKQTNSFLERVKKISSELAKQKGYKAVADPKLFLWYEYDLTDDIIKELGK